MTRTETQTQAAVVTVALAPVVLLVAFVAHPYLAVLPDADGVATAVMSNTTLWGVAHLLTNLASALLALAFLAIRAHLREAGDDRFSRWGLPFVVFGSVLYGFLPGLEFAPLAAAETGGDVTAVQASLEPWFVSMFVTGTLTFAAGIFAFCRGITATRVLGARTTRVVVTALAVMAVARAVPLGAVQFYVQGLAGLVALWPMAVAMGRARAAAPVPRRPSPAT